MSSLVRHGDHKVRPVPPLSAEPVPRMTFEEFLAENDRQLAKAGLAHGVPGRYHRELLVILLFLILWLLIG